MTPDEKASAEAWLCRRLAEHRSPVAPGLEPLEVRLRQAIASAGLEVVIAGRGRDRKPFTYAQALERLYGVSPSDSARANRDRDMRSRGKPLSRSDTYCEVAQ